METDKDGIDNTEPGRETERKDSEEKRAQATSNTQNTSQPLKLDIELEWSPAKNCFIVTSIGNGKDEVLGIKAGDQVTTINGKSLSHHPPKSCGAKTETADKTGPESHYLLGKTQPLPKTPETAPDNDPDPHPQETIEQYVHRQFRGEYTRFSDPVAEGGPYRKAHLQLLRKRLEKAGRNPDRHPIFEQKRKNKNRDLIAQRRRRPPWRQRMRQILGEEDEDPIAEMDGRSPWRERMERTRRRERRKEREDQAPPGYFAESQDVVEDPWETNTSWLTESEKEALNVERKNSSSYWNPKACRWWEEEEIVKKRAENMHTASDGDLEKIRRRPNFEYFTVTVNLENEDRKPIGIFVNEIPRGVLVTRVEKSGLGRPYFNVWDRICAIDGTQVTTRRDLNRAVRRAISDSVPFQVVIERPGYRSAYLAVKAEKTLLDAERERKQLADKTEEWLRLLKDPNAHQKKNH